MNSSKYLKYLCDILNVTNLNFTFKSKLILNEMGNHFWMIASLQ